MSRISAAPRIIKRLVQNCESLNLDPKIHYNITRFQRRTSQDKPGLTGGAHPFKRVKSQVSSQAAEPGPERRPRQDLSKHQKASTGSVQVDERGLFQHQHQSQTQTRTSLPEVAPQNPERTSGIRVVAEAFEVRKRAMAGQLTKVLAKDACPRESKVTTFAI